MRISRKSVLSATVENLDLAISHFAAFVPAMEIIHGTAVVRRIDLKDRTYNMVMNAQFTKQNASCEIERIIDLFKEKALPFSWWVCPSDRPHNLKELLHAKGLVVKEVDANMYLDLSQYEEKEIAPLQCRMALNHSQLQDFISIQASIGRNPEAFDMIYSKLPASAYTAGSPVGLHLGYVDGKPVVTGMLVIQNGVAGIYFVATEPGERRKNYATKMMRYLLATAKNAGCKMAVLESSQLGKRLYENLGFIENDSFIEMILPE